MKLTRVLLFVLVGLSVGRLVGAEKDIRGSVFVSTLGGAVSFKVALARVYTLSEKEAEEMLQRNRASLGQLFEEAEREQAAAQRKRVEDYNSEVDRIEKRRIALEEEVSTLEQRIVALQADSAVASLLEADKLILQRNAKVQSYEQLKQEASAISSKRPGSVALSGPPIEKSVEVMFRAPTEQEFVTRSDSEGSFVIQEPKKDVACILITTKENSPKMKWFLRLKDMRKDGDKYLFTEENNIWSEDKAQVVRIKKSSGKYEFVTQ